MFFWRIRGIGLLLIQAYICFQIKFLEEILWFMKEEIRSAIWKMFNAHWTLRLDDNHIDLWNWFIFENLVLYFSMIWFKLSNYLELSWKYNNFLYITRYKCIILSCYMLMIIRISVIKEARESFLFFLCSFLFLSNLISV